MSMSSNQAGRLSLSRETIRQLGEDELGRAIGARAVTYGCPTPPVIHTYPFNQCVIYLSQVPGCA
jgi:hypothetical protein